MTIFNRVWAMPSGDTFSIKPIYNFVKKYCDNANTIIDPFARNNKFATYTNDLNPNTEAQLHLDAEQAIKVWEWQNIKADLFLFDPPYSPRQISELYKSIGLDVGMKETQSGAMYKRCRDAADRIIIKNGIVLSFGWHSNGMGINRGYELIEILLVAHGGAHNDTICIAERKT